MQEGSSGTLVLEDSCSPYLSMLICHVEGNSSHYTSEHVSDVFKTYPSLEDTNTRSILVCSNKTDKTLQKVANKASSVVNHSHSVEDPKKIGKPLKGKEKGENPFQKELPVIGEVNALEGNSWKMMRKGLLRPGSREDGAMNNVLEIHGFASCLSCRSQGVLGVARVHVHLFCTLGTMLVCFGDGMGRDGVSACHGSPSLPPPLGYALVALANIIPG